MKLRRYQTRRGLWYAVSAIVFLAIGLLVEFDVKGQKECLLRLIAEPIGGLFSGLRSLADARFLALWLGTWIAVAAVVGWLLQSIIVIAFCQRKETSKTSH